MAQYLLNFTDGQKDAIRRAAQLSCVSMAEVLRRTIDHCFFHSDAADHIFPAASGQMAREVENAGGVGAHTVRTSGDIAY